MLQHLLRNCALIVSRNRCLLWLTNRFRCLLMIRNTQKTKKILTTGNQNTHLKYKTEGQKVIPQNGYLNLCNRWIKVRSFQLFPNMLDNIQANPTNENKECLTQIKNTIHFRYLKSKYSEALRINQLIPNYMILLCY